jgi:hypothetical protein
MSIGVLTRKSTEWTRLYHCDQASMDLEVHVPEVDSVPGRHIGNSRNRELTERLLGHGSSSSRLSHLVLRTKLDIHYM